MNSIISEELTLFTQELKRFLSPGILQKMAKEIDFDRRESKYQAKNSLPFASASIKKSLAFHLNNRVVDWKLPLG